MRSRLAASAKKANTCSHGNGTLMDALRTWSATVLNCRWPRLSWVIVEVVDGWGPIPASDDRDRSISGCGGGVLSLHPHPFTRPRLTHPLLAGAPSGGGAR